MQEIELKIESLESYSFKAFGDVIETENRSLKYINNGMATRFHDLAEIDVLEDEGRPLINIFRSKCSSFPVRIKMMERHPLSSQAFMPLSSIPFLIIVAQESNSISAEDLRVFISNGRQGVNYRRGVWHHPLIALKKESDFLIVDRGGKGKNCEEFWFENEYKIVVKSSNGDKNQIS